jgi:hypothetical protein
VTITFRDLISKDQSSDYAKPMTNAEAASRHRVRLPALPIGSFDPETVHFNIRYRSLQIASQLALLDLKAAGYSHGAGELEIKPEYRATRIIADLRHSPTGSSSRTCADLGSNGGVRFTEPAPKPVVSLPRLSIMEASP